MASLPNQVYTFHMKSYITEEAIKGQLCLSTNSAEVLLNNKRNVSKIIYHGTHTHMCCRLACGYTQREIPLFQDGPTQPDRSRILHPQNGQVCAGGSWLASFKSKHFYFIYYYFCPTALFVGS